MHARLSRMTPVFAGSVGPLWYDLAVSIDTERYELDHAAAEMLIVAGDNIDRVRSEPAWARLCGVAPNSPRPPA